MEKGKITRNITEELQSSFFLSVFKFPRLKLYMCMYSPMMSNTTVYNSACYNVAMLKSAARVRLNQTLLPTSYLGHYCFNFKQLFDSVTIIAHMIFQILHLMAVYKGG